MNPVPGWFRRQSRSYGPIVLIAVVAMGIDFWYLTNGTYRLFGFENFGAIYDSMAAHMLQGRVDVGEEIRGEGFHVNGRTVSYFLPAPAIPRMLLNRWFPSNYGRWTKTSMLLMVLLSIWASVAFFRTVQPRLVPGAQPGLVWMAETLLVVAIALGSTLTFLTSRAFIFHEAIIWGAAWCLAALLFALRYWLTKRPAYLAGASIGASISFYSRLTTGVPALAIVAAVAVAALIANRRLRMPWLALGGVFVTGMGLLEYNHARFGNWLDPVPIRYHEQYTPERLRQIDGRMADLALIPTSLAAYWICPEISLSARFPWIEFVEPKQSRLQNSAIHYDDIEAHTSVSSSMPGLLLLSALGFVYAGIQWVRGTRWPAALLMPLLAGMLLVLPVKFMAERYVHDFFPLLVVAGSLGMCRLLSLRPRRRGTAMILTGVLLLIQVPVTLALMFTYQRDNVWGIPDYRLRQLNSITDTLTSAARHCWFGASTSVPGADRRAPVDAGD